MRHLHSIFSILPTNRGTFATGQIFHVIPLKVREDQLLTSMSSVIFVRTGQCQRRTISVNSGQFFRVANAPRPPYLNIVVRKLSSYVGESFFAGKNSPLIFQNLPLPPSISLVCMLLNQ